MKRIFLIGYILAYLFLSSCSTMYIPPMTNVPLLENKGETQIDIGASTTSLYLSGDYAFSNKYAIQFNGNASFHNFSSYYDIFTNDSTNRTGGMFTPDYDWGEFSHRYGEIGIGRYNILNSDWKLETFIGSGIGTGFEEVYDMHSDYYLGFIQCNAGRKLKNNNFEFGFACRIAYSNFNLVYDRFEDGNKTELSFDNISAEPNVFFRVGTRSVRFYSKIGFNILYCFDSFEGIDLARGIRDEQFNFTSLHFSIGLNFRFGQSKKN